MREIKFRAWDHVSKEFIGKFHIISTGGVKVFTDSLSFGGRGTWSYISEERCKLMQYTGLKDKNGKEIYEGDLLSCNFNQTHEVIWESYFAQYKTKHLASGVVSDVYKDVLEEAFEIIGNIHENPELLEK